MNFNQESLGDLGNVNMRESSFENEKPVLITENKITLPRPVLTEDDEFWKDCLSNNLDKAIKPIKHSNPKPLGSLNTSVNIIDTLNNYSPNNITHSKTPLKTTENNAQILTTVEDRLKKMKVKYGEDVIDPEKSPEKIRERERKKQSLQRCRSLYERAVIQKRVQDMVIQKSMEIKRDKELQECSFRPRINVDRFLNSSDSGRMANPINPRYVYDRQFGLMMSKREKIEHITNVLNNRESEYPFKPRINMKNPKIFAPENSIINDFTTRNYLVRLENARREKLMKISNIYEPVKSASTKSIRRINRSSSAESSFFYQNKVNSSGFFNAMKYLHEDLTNFNINVDI